MAEQTNVVPTLNFQRTDDFISLYANNIQFEQTAFDLKLIFGELNQAGGKVLIDQHSSVTIPWGQAKLLLYYLQLNIAGYELENGKIKIRGDLVPLPIGPLPAGQEDNPKVRELFEVVKNLREQFVSNL